MVFFIEDTTPLGSYYLDKEGMTVPFSIFQVKEFKEILTKAVKIDYFFNGITYFSRNEMFLVSRDKLNVRILNSCMKLIFQRRNILRLIHYRLCLFKYKYKKRRLMINDKECNFGLL